MRSDSNSAQYRVRLGRLLLSYFSGLFCVPMLHTFTELTLILQIFRAPKFEVNVSEVSVWSICFVFKRFFKDAQTGAGGP